MNCSQSAIEFVSINRAGKLAAEALESYGNNEARAAEHRSRLGANTVRLSRLAVRRGRIIAAAPPPVPFVPGNTMTSRHFQVPHASSAVTVATSSSEQHRRISGIDADHLDGPGFRCFCINAQMNLLPSLPFHAVMLARTPFTFTRHPDPCAVHCSDRILPSNVRDGASKCSGLIGDRELPHSRRFIGSSEC